MSQRELKSAILITFLFTAVAVYAGAWAVITVEELADYAVVGKPFNLVFTVRQHGRRLLSDLRPKIQARAGTQEVNVTAAPAKEAGRYAATLMLPQPGEWTITIYSGFITSNITLLPIKAVAADSAPLPALEPAERGRRLFVSKGCISCHLHKEASASSIYPIAPELTYRRYQSAYLARLLAGPALLLSSSRSRWEMPELGLKPTEIEALVAFINAERSAASR